MDNRKLAAILAADVVGYSHMIGEDEGLTLECFREIRSTIVDATIAKQGGRVFKLMGDGILAEFPSAVRALQAAIDIQHLLKERNDQCGLDRRMTMRVGVHQGDVVVEEGDLLGDGVNVAARLESLAPVGGICISARVFEDSIGKVLVDVRDMGEVILKNITRPVRVYAIDPHQHAAAMPGSNPTPTKSRGSTLCISLTPFKIIGANEMGLPLDAGLFEEVAAHLTRYRDLEVIQFTSDQSSQASSQSGYSLSGTIQFSGDSVRVTAKLVENDTRRATWSERWDRKLEDVFLIQSEIADGIVNCLAGYSVILHTAAERASRTPPANLSAYEFYLLGLSHNNRFNLEDAKKALAFFSAALELDRNFARAWLGAAWSYDQLNIFSGGSSEYEMLFVQSARKAVELDPMDAEAHLALGEALGHVGDPEAEEEAFDRAMSLGPGNADVLAMFAGWAARVGRQKQAEMAADKARRLNPRWPVWYNNYFRRVFFFGGRYEDALSCVTRKPLKSRSLDDVTYAACCSAALSRPEDLRDWRVQAVAMGYQNKDHFLLFAGVTIAQQRQIFTELLQRAGFE
jgi:class 3 adenylate cyclase/TolB-like protein